MKRVALFLFTTGFGNILLILALLAITALLVISSIPSDRVYLPGR